MDILIKSFNRPYYLDRCLYSISKHVKNWNGNIMILDDGTPELFLNKISSKYPFVEIIKSDFYDKKQKFTSQGIKPNEYLIPINFWVEQAKKASDNFILLEDDIWFVDDIDIKEVEIDILENNLVFTKLFWLGNSKINKSKEEVIKNNIVIIKPKLMTIIPAFYYFIFYKFDRFKIRKTLRFLKINTEEKRLAYYSIYSVSGAIFNNKYFNKLWINHQNKIDEGLQTFNAVKFFYKQREKINFGHYKKEILKTGFISSATNQHKERYYGNVDMFIFNKIINEAWYNNQFDSLLSLPKDINEKEIITILENDLEKRIKSKDWSDWVKSFKDEYIKIGCVLD
ncbi:hypothetical protein [Flavobacterium sp.]|uniref:hypothetical protein n=1 Tax=Flavobacterium sp. TaxID=239 RepID=UPI00374FFE4E